MRKMLASLLLLCGSLATPALVHAGNTFGTDFSDMWWVPTESGWGANIANQGPILFVTLYTYGGDGKVKWYVAPRMEANISPIYAGSLFETSGPIPSGAFDTTLMNYRHVGSITLDFTSSTQGLLGYSVDGLNSSKTIVRYTFATADLTGFYVGATVSAETTCVSAGTKNATFAITQTGNALSISTLYATGLSCQLNASYVQEGRMGSFVGTQSCSDGNTYTYRATEVEASYQGVFGKYTTQGSNGCVQSGRFGGMKS